MKINNRKRNELDLEFVSSTKNVLTNTLSVLVIWKEKQWKEDFIF